MVVAGELPYLETLAHWTFQSYRLKFRSLAWEGDTVFEQRRDLNYPSLEAQLDKIGATVVIAQFGQTESLAGEEKVDEFVVAYEKLISRLRGTSKRRLVLIEPTPWIVAPSQNGVQEKAAKHGVYCAAIRKMVDGMQPDVRIVAAFDILSLPNVSRDGMHLTADAHLFFAIGVLGEFIPDVKTSPSEREIRVHPFVAQRADVAQISSLVAAKNRLWFNYSRPQNWAFLAGDRTNQPSSRDHVDRNKRWFPEELEKFVPLIEAKEKEIWELAAKLSH